jgi:hypothetical protein
MGGRQLLTVAFCSLVCVGYANTLAHAGWFGPSTYDECILDEMKGRPGYMMPTVKSDCTAKFCTEVPLTEEEKVELKKASDKCQSESQTYNPFCPFVSTTRLVCK